MGTAPFLAGTSPRAGRPLLPALKPAAPPGDDKNLKYIFTREIF
jgi:hypothetical protein